MEAALVLNVVLAVTSVVAAGIAGWQAYGAHSDRVAAEVAVEVATRAASASERQAEAAERALALQEALTQPAPWVWQYVRGDVYAIVRNHTRPASDVSIETFPGDTLLYNPRFEKSGVYQFGDRIEFRHYPQAINPPHRVVVTWRDEGMDDERSFTFSM